MTKKYRVAVVGATGNVGREMLKILHERNFPISELLAVASSRSAGSQVVVEDSEYSYPVLDLAKMDFKGVDIILSSAGSKISKEFADRATMHGAVVIDNTSYFRMMADVPLIVPEVNGDELKDFYHRYPRRIIANPNCSTAQLVLALKPIHDLVTIKRVVVATYQSVSGTGKEAMEELFQQSLAVFNQTPIDPEIYPKQIAFNCIPHIDDFMDDGATKEEWKMAVETQKIMRDDSIHLIATCVRVPVFIGHSEAVVVECAKPIDLNKIRDALTQAKGVVVYDKHEPSGYVTPLDSVGEDASFISRLRLDKTANNAIAFWCVSDNLRKGAALNAVQIAEELIQYNH